MRHAVQSAEQGPCHAALRIDPDGRDGFGELARLAADLAVGPACLRREARDFDGDDHLVGRQCRGEGTDEEFRRTQASLASCPQGDKGGVEQVHGVDPVGRRVGVCQAAAEGAAVAHGAVGNACRDLGEQAAGHIGQFTVLDACVRHGGADAQCLIVRLELRHRGDAAHVDQLVHLGQAQVEHGAQRLAAAADLGKFRAAQQRHCLVDAVGAPVVEGGGFHATTPTPARRRAARIRRGDAGLSMISTPSLASASLMALTMAAGGAMAPPSPMPFCPNSV